jgi:di/tricarboxylate transporter
MGVTIIFLLIGGFILGPIVQKYSFGQFWTGWPLGEDMTDNKVLFALIAFLIAWFLRKKSYGRWLAIAAALVMLAVYLIPHSMNGSELNIETGEVVTGSFMILAAGTGRRRSNRSKHTGHAALPV